MAVGADREQLGGHQQPPLRPQGGPLEDRVGAELARDLGEGQRRALEVQDRLPGDDAQRRAAPDLVGEGLGDRVGQVLVLGEAGEVLERQHRQHGLGARHAPSHRRLADFVETLQKPSDTPPEGDAAATGSGTAESGAE